MSEATSGVDEALIASLAALRMDPLNTGIYRSHEKQQGVFDRPRLLTATHTTHTGLAWLQYLPQLPTHAVEFVDSLHSAQSHSVTRTLVRRKGPFFFFFFEVNKHSRSRRLEGEHEFRRCGWAILCCTSAVA